MSKIRTLKRRIKTICNNRAPATVVDRIRGRKLDRIRRRVLLRDEYTCRVCGRVSVDLVIDHIVPLHLGGPESDENRQAICCDCHAAKSAEEEKGRR